MKITTTKSVTSQETTEVEIPDENLAARTINHIHIAQTVIDGMHITVYVNEKDEQLQVNVVPFANIEPSDVKELQTESVNIDSLTKVQKSLQTFTAMFEAAVSKHVKANRG